MLWVDLDGPGELAIGIYDNETDINYTDTTGLFYLPRYTDQFSNQLPIQYVVESITAAGSLLSTETTFGVGDPTETFAVVEPTLSLLPLYPHWLLHQRWQAPVVSQQ